MVGREVGREVGRLSVCLSGHGVSSVGVLDGWKVVCVFWAGG